MLFSPLPQKIIPTSRIETRLMEMFFPQKIIPLQQGLKLFLQLEMVSVESSVPQKIIPLQQGLKP